MKKVIISIIVVIAGFNSFSQSLQQIESKRVKLSNGWSLVQVGKSLPLGDLPLNLVISNSKKYAAVTNNGYGVQSIELIDIKNEKILDNVVIPKSWYGLKFSSDEKFLYASGGNDNWIMKYAIENWKLVLKDSIKLGKKWPEKISPAGIEIDDKAQKMYVVTRENNSLYVIDLLTKKMLSQYPLPAEGYGCILSPDKKELYISCWGCDKVLVFDTWPERFDGQITVGDNPNELCLNKAGTFLFVANGNDNSVSVINLRDRKVVETLDAALYPHAPAGSTSNGLALSPDEKILYIANADNNCLAVFDVSRPGWSKSRGFIPTGWYPTNVKVVGKKIFVTNGKGLSSMANPYGPNPAKRREATNYQNGDSTKPISVQYIAGLFKGTLSIINVPADAQLAVYSQAVYDNTPYTKEKETISAGEAGSPIPMKLGDPSPIKHVFYVIKENRTYDQVLGDIKEGNGDNNLVLFGEKITPNQHNLAKEFVLLDNFYCDGEVSSDGHNWSMGAYATDYLEKTWPTDYSQRGGTYAGEGSRVIANNKLFIWDQCKAKNISYRSYGEFIDSTGFPRVAVLNDHYCPYFRGWDLNVKDTTRFFQWKKEFDSLVASDAVPAFNSVRFPNDHTEGLKKGKPTPFVDVADNDWAVGMFIEYLSKSQIWKESVVFIVEDDAQNGPDHVDAHRTTAYVAGGLVKRHFVDHTMYSTTSILRTIELILGLPPMTQYDAAATSMWRGFNKVPDITPFMSVPPNLELGGKNMVMNEWQRRSGEFDFSKEDAIPDMEFNKVLWYGIIGEARPMPAPRRAAFVRVKKDDD